MSKSHQHEAQNVHSASVCSKVKIAIAISLYLSQACQQESTSKEQDVSLNRLACGAVLAKGSEQSPAGAVGKHIPVSWV